MKKLVSVVAAFVLCLAMTTTCFAASPVKATQISLPAGTTMTEVSAETSKAIAQATTAENLAKLVGSSTASVVSVFELNGNGGEVKVGIAGIKAGDTVKVLHWVGGDMTKAPEVLDATTGDGTVTFTTATCSPFAVVKVASAAVSPKTSEAGAMAAVAVMLISAAGIVVLNRRKFA